LKTAFFDGLQAGIPFFHGSTRALQYISSAPIYPIWRADCAYFVLTSTTFQLIPATSSQDSDLIELFDAVGLSGVE